MAQLSAEQRAAILIWRLLQESGLDINTVKFHYDIAQHNLEQSESDSLDNIVQFLLTGQGNVFPGYESEPSDYGLNPSPEINPQDGVAGSEGIQPNIDGGGAGLATGGPPMSVEQSVNNLNIKKGQPKKQGGTGSMDKTDFQGLRQELLKQAFKADMNNDNELLSEIQAALLLNELESKKAERSVLLKEALKADVNGDTEKSDNLSEVIAEIEDGIRYLERDWNAFKKVDKFPEQEDGVVTMGYAKPEYDMGDDHTINPQNVMDPEGKIPDMEQFPSGDDKRVKDFDKAKPRIPMAEDGKGDSSISKTVEDLETVKVLDEPGDVHQKEQPSVPDDLSKLASDISQKKITKEVQAQAEVLEQDIIKIAAMPKESAMEKEAVWQALVALLPTLVELLPVITRVLPVLSEVAPMLGQVSQILPLLGTLSEVMPQLEQLTQVLPQLQNLDLSSLGDLDLSSLGNLAAKIDEVEMIVESANMPTYTIEVTAGKYEKIKKIIFPPTEEDPNGHFPINTKGRAQNALSRVNQYDNLPSWAKKRGVKSLKQLKERVCRKVHKEYPGIEISEKSA